MEQLILRYEFLSNVVYQFEVFLKTFSRIQLSQKSQR